MPTAFPNMTPYADVNQVLHTILSGAHTILADRFVGMYLYGSLALGDFAPGRSDIDFLVVTTGDTPEDDFLALQAMHDGIAASDSPWAMEIEGSYIPQEALRRYDPANVRHPHIDRGGGRLRIEQHDTDWVVQRHVLREHGTVLAGPPLDSLIDPVLPRELRGALLELMRGWWAPMLDDPTHLRSPGYQDYAVLTMCRVLYTLEYGTIVSKPVAARWAQATLDERWVPIIERALAWGHDLTDETLNDTLSFIRYTVERIAQDEPQLS
jgi:hypothetical protein